MAVTPFRQEIWAGDQGSDVKAVKRAMRAMKMHGSEDLVIDNIAGKTFITILNNILRSHGQRQDGKYGPKAHAIIAPHFDLYGISLYRKAKIRSRKPPIEPIISETAIHAAHDLIGLMKSGKYRADNPGDLRDLQATANGSAVWSQGGYWVRLDPRPLRLLLWLIKEHGYSLGTYAFCSDHHNDGPHGHSGGLAVDISSINGRGIIGGGMHDATLKLLQVIHTAPAGLHPRQLICGGSGLMFYKDIENLCVPSPSFYGWQTLSEHRNHIHVGY